MGMKTKMLNLRSYQLEALYGDGKQPGLYPWFEKNDGNPLIVLPTGSGKSLVAAQISEDVLKWQGRILQLTHVRELVEQNFSKLHELSPGIDAGIYCAGLDRKQHHHPVTVASIQSVHNKAELIGWRDIILIDECHLLSDDNNGMYRKFLAAQRAINPNVKVVGLSATPYRLKSGYLHKGADAMFTGVAYDLPVGRLVKEGYLSALITPRADTQVDTASIALQAGEFNQKQMQEKFDQSSIVKAAVNEIINKGKDRKTWLIFCVSIEHAEHVRAALEAQGITAAMVCDKTPKDERDGIKRDFAAGRIRAVCNVAVWTTGLDVVGIDLIALLRATMSPGLLVQMLGRGMRPVYAPGADLSSPESRLAAIAAGSKPNCLVLDMASNLEMHGPITHIRIPDGRRDKADRQGKRCKECGAINPFDAMECIDCGKEFFKVAAPREVKHGRRASGEAVMSDEPAISEIPTWLNVKKINFEVHQKFGSPDSLRVTYNCSPNYVSEYVCFGHTGFARTKAEQWWGARGGRQQVPRTANEALSRLTEIAGVKVRRIKVQKNGKYTNVMTAELVAQQTNLHIDNGNLGHSTAIQLPMEENNAAIAP